jgi:hypothetical protein
VRSAKAIDLLKQSGFKKLRNMKGEILVWSDQVDPSVPKHYADQMSGFSAVVSGSCIADVCSDAQLEQ